MMLNSPLTDEELLLMKEALIEYDGFLGSGELTEFIRKLISLDMVNITPNSLAGGYEYQLNTKAIEFFTQWTLFNDTL